MAPVDREVLLPPQKTLALPSFSHHVTPLLRIIIQLQLTKIQTGQIGNVVFGCSFGVSSSSTTLSDKERNWVGVQEEQREKKKAPGKTYSDRKE